MRFSLDSLSFSLLAMIPLTEFLVFIAIFLIVRWMKIKRNDNRRYPPSFPCLPILGSLPFIRNFENLPEFFMKKAMEMGPVFTLKFGDRNVLVLNNFEAIEDALVRHGSSFSGRESFFIERHVNRNRKGIGSMNYNNAFKKYRKLSMSVLKEFGFGHKSKMETLILTEVVQLIEHMKKTNGKAFDPKEMLRLSVSNVVYNMLFGKRRRFEDGLSDIYVHIMRMVEAIDPSLDLFPVLRVFYRKKLSQLRHHGERVTELIRQEIEEALENSSVDCFVNRYVEKEGKDYDQEQLIFTLRDFVAGSLETSSTAILWLMVKLANNPHVAERVQKEIDSVVPRDRLPSGSDRELLSYTEATVLEILRHRAVIPLSVPHLTLHDTEVLGYFIPANTVVLPNIKSAHMNQLDWPDAEEFRPERFLDQENKLINKDKVNPFSSGKRSCLGETLARHQLFLFISGLVQNFSFRPPEGATSISERIKSGGVDAPYPFVVRAIARDA